MTWNPNPERPKPWSEHTDVYGGIADATGLHVPDEVVVAELTRLEAEVESLREALNAAEDEIEGYQQLARDAWTRAEGLESLLRWSFFDAENADGLTRVPGYDGGFEICWGSDKCGVSYSSASGRYTLTHVPGCRWVEAQRLLGEPSGE